MVYKLFFDVLFGGYCKAMDVANFDNRTGYLPFLHNAYYSGLCVWNSTRMTIS